MLSHATYKVIHLLGIFLLFTGFGGLWSSAAETGGQRARRLFMVVHGVAMTLILVAGFGMMARLQISHSWPLWIWIKAIIWVLLAGLPILLKRLQSPPRLLLFLAPILGTIAAYAALFHLGQTP